MLIFSVGSLGHVQLNIVGGCAARFGATFVSAQTVNDADEIVGYYQDAAGAFHGFLAIPDSPEKE